MTEQVQVFTEEQVQALRGPYVYMWHRHGELLYVGVKTGRYSARPFEPDHHRLGDPEGGMQPGDEVVIYPMESREVALQTEKELIWNMKPKLNVVGKLSVARIPVVDDSEFGWLSEVSTEDLRSELRARRIKDNPVKTNAKRQAAWRARRRAASARS